MAEEPAVRQTEHSFAQPRDHLARQCVLCGRVCACGDGEQDARSVLEQRRKAYHWIRHGAALGRRPAEALLIGIGVQYTKRCPIDGDNSPRLVPRTFQPLLRQRPDESSKQLLERFDAKTLTRLGDGRLRRQRSMNWTILTHVVEQMTKNLPRSSTTHQAESDRVVHHQRGWQLPFALTFPSGLPQNLLNLRQRKLGVQNSQPVHVLTPSRPSHGPPSHAQVCLKLRPLG